MKKVKKSSRILHEVHEAARDLFDAGVMDAATMRRFDALCFLQGFMPFGCRCFRRADRTR